MDNVRPAEVKRRAAVDNARPAAVDNARRAAVDSASPADARRQAVVAAANRAEGDGRKPAVSVSVKRASVEPNLAMATKAGAGTWPASQSRDPLPISKWRVRERNGKSQVSGEPQPVVNPIRRASRRLPFRNEETEMVAG
jgi:hypothetical protein